MRPTLLSMIGALLLSCFSVSLHADDSITEYGIYLKTADGYTALSNIPTRRHLNYDFTGRMFSFTVAEPASKQPEILIYYPEFHPSWLEVQARSMGVAAGRSPLEVSISEVGEDKFLAKARGSVDPASIVLVSIGCCVEGVHGIALSDPTDGIASIYGEGTDHSPTTAEYVLSNIVDAVPDNQAMVELHGYWKEQVTAKEAADHYAFMEKQWQGYENADSRERKVQKLEAVSTLAQQYQDKYPEGEHAKQVAKRKQQADEKLNF